MSVRRARPDAAPDIDLVLSRRKHRTEAADDNVPCPVKTICVMTSRKVLVKTVVLLDANSPSCAPSYGTRLPLPQVHRRIVTATRPHSV